ncbi:3-dehydroquinate synthase [Aneurinibacillus terranovensis]|uniref:3-dehydroquinate synthase n=1 Tax=Aneurinibacillus terranovensis TaxID=278991 RepID=UPI0003FC3BBB|nr:3-dehydroquinate synthase [Aneurinibacillus terranovensis]
MEDTRSLKCLEVALGERSYPIWIGPGAVDELPRLFREQGIGTNRRLFIITDENVAPLYLNKVEHMLTVAGYIVSHAVVAAGEKAKSLPVFEQMITRALEAGLDRKSVFIALGGGVVGDLTGYVAAAYMRGVDFVQVPTTLLAHDSSVGGKVAVNHPLAKNVIGAFHQPKFVAYDTALLTSLPAREVAAGFAEVIKHGLLWDESFVTWIEEHAAGLQALDHSLLQEAIYRACSIKVAVVSKDERESGLRAILNLGHTFAHAFESLTGYGTINHGEAVAIGMVAAARLAEKLGLAENISRRTQTILEDFKLPVRLTEDLDIPTIIEVMRRDKKGENGKLVFVLPAAIGKVVIKKDVPEAPVCEVLHELKGGS